MKNVFLIKSPLQLLNAVEAKHYFGLSDDDCILIIMGDRKSYPQMMNLAKVDQQWKNVILLNRVNLLFGDPWLNTIVDYSDVKSQRETLLRSSFYTIWRFNRLAKHICNVDNIFFGDHKSEHLRHFINSVEHKRTVLLDDGTATVDDALKRQENKNNPYVLKLRKKIKLASKRLFQGLKDQQPEKIYFFTVYDIKAGGEDEVIRNNFTYLRSKNSTSSMSGDVYFVGTPLSEVGIMKESDYFNQLVKVKEYFKGREFIYIAHRREDKGKLNRIRENLDINIKIFEYPLEYQIAMIGPAPEIMAAFVTSVLENMRMIMGDKLQIISFKLIDGSYADKQTIDAVYDYYRENTSGYFNVKLLE